MNLSELASMIPGCCSEVLDTMYFTTLLGSKTMTELPGCLEVPGGASAFKLHFAGDISGQFGVHMEQATARSLAANFLGEAAPHISIVEINEVAAELANMLCGSVMSRFEGKHRFSLSHPEAGTAPTDADNMLASLLETAEGIVTVWIQIGSTNASIE